MKKIILLVFIFVTCFVQAQEPEPDSLVGIYVGNLYFKEISETNWDLIESNCNEYITLVDASSCQVDICYEAGTINQFPGLKSLYTDYSYCNDTFAINEPGESYVYFYSEDSLIIIWYGVYGPPNYTHYLEKFYGKRIPNSSYVGLNEVEPVNIRLNLYPNPSCDILFFDLPGSDMINCNVTIRNVFGSIVYCDELSGENCFIDVSGFAEGIYFFEWKNGVLVYNKRFVVNR